MTLVDSETGELAPAPVFDWPAGVHPAADLFPMIDRDDFAKLVDDIRINGLLEPIWLDKNGLLLDGRNRLAACQHLHIDPETRTYPGDKAVEFVLSLNVHRRHLTASQLATVALEALPLFEEQAHARQVATLKQGPVGAIVPERKERKEVTPIPKGRAPRARDEAAAAVGVSGRAVGQAKRVADEAPDLIEKVKSGEMTLNAAEQEVKARKPPKPKRGDLAKDATKAGWELRKSVERLEKIAADDRFTANKEQVAAIWCDHLRNAIGVCQDLLDGFTNGPQEDR